MNCTCSICGGKGSVCRIEKATLKYNVLVATINMAMQPPIMRACASCRQRYGMSIK